MTEQRMPCVRASYDPSWCLMHHATIKRGKHICPIRRAQR